jgi:hypothetical protein
MRLETPWRGRTLWLFLVSAAWTLPLWIVAYPPMLDFPQQLALASIIRWYDDPVRQLQQAYELTLARPQGLFELLVAGLARVLPILTAGKLVVAFSLAAVVPCAAALCRRTGRPQWYALLTLAVTYNHAFYWGFADNLLAYPLVLGGVWLADRSFDRPFGGREWLLLAAWTALFYAVHLQFLLVFAGAVGWLAIVRRPGWRRMLLWLSALLPGIALGVGVLAWAHVHAAEVMTGFQQRLDSSSTLMLVLEEKIRRIPGLLFGAYRDGLQWVLAGFLLALVLLLVVRRRGVEEAVDAADAGEPEPRGGRRLGTRFASLAGWIFVLYLILPVFTHGYLVAERLLPLAAMLLVPALPRPPASRRRVAAILVAGLLLFQLGQTSARFLSFSAETAGIRELLAGTEPGQNLMGLVFEPEVSGWSAPPLLEHFPAYYQVEKGGRVLLSFAQFFNSPVSYGKGQNWEDGLLAEWGGGGAWSFVYERDAPRFRYFLVRGGPEHILAAFGPHSRELRMRNVGRWYLIERVPGAMEGRAFGGAAARSSGGKQAGTKSGKKGAGHSGPALAHYASFSSGFPRLLAWVSLDRQ